jgi:hypothetical protein
MKRFIHFAISKLSRAIRANPALSDALILEVHETNLRGKMRNRATLNSTLSDLVVSGILPF